MDILNEVTFEQRHIGHESQQIYMFQKDLQYTPKYMHYTNIYTIYTNVPVYTPRISPSHTCAPTRPDHMQCAVYVTVYISATCISLSIICITSIHTQTCYAVCTCMAMPAPEIPIITLIYMYSSIHKYRALCRVIHITYLESMFPLIS